MDVVEKEVMDIITDKLLMLLYKYLSNDWRHSIQSKWLSGNSTTLIDLEKALIEDLISYVQRDPATGGDHELVASTSQSFSAVIHYRLANLLWNFSENPKLRESAYKITEASKIARGFDIHPAARIGPRFVLDHAHSIVIGETTVIGSDCYMLGGVTLGAKGIARNESNIRHPQIGNNVQIGTSVRIFGPVRIGCDVFIAPNCVITSDIPDGTRVSIINQVQIAKHSKKKASISGFFVSESNAYLITSCNHLQSVEVTDSEFRKIPGIRCYPEESRNSICRIHLEIDDDARDYLNTGICHLRVHSNDGESILINPNGLEFLISNKLKGAHGQYAKYREEHRALI